MACNFMAVESLPAQVVCPTLDCVGTGVSPAQAEGSSANAPRDERLPGRGRPGLRKSGTSSRLRLEQRDLAFVFGSAPTASLGPADHAQYGERGQRRTRHKNALRIGPRVWR